MKRLMTGLARRAGYEVQPHWRMPRLAAARKLRRLFDLLEIRYVLDVGANTGQFRDFLRLEVGFSGVIHSFEPIAALVSTLRQRKSDDDSWFIHPYALGARSDEREINVMSSTVFSSFLEPNNALVPQFQSLNSVASKERVTIRRLDELLDTELHAADLGRTYLKLDTQGFDLEVLEGGRMAIAGIPALQTEISMQPIYERMPAFTDSLAAFADAGFAVSDFFLVSEDKYLRANEFDCLMVRDPSTPRIDPARM